LVGGGSEQQVGKKVQDFQQVEPSKLASGLQVFPREEVEQ
jgi:hypothetical protein